MPRGDQQPVESLLDDKAWAREPARVANVQFGHTVKADHPHTDRWTCVMCGRAVLRDGANIHGSAVREHCQPAVEGDRR